MYRYLTEHSSFINIIINNNDDDDDDDDNDNI